MFNQNCSESAFQYGAYDEQADQPTTSNWTRQSNYAGPQDPYIKWCLTFDDHNIHSCPVIGEEGNVLIGSATGTSW